MSTYNFPRSFLWGAALSSYQCEGNNYNTDWYIWEKEKGLSSCNLASLHYEKYKEDIELAFQLNLKALRISIEWARINPQPGEFKEEEVVHYIDVVDTLRKFNLVPFITLNHFTLPLWFYKKGGWENYDNIDYFIEYITKIVSVLKDKVQYWLVLNEPLIYIYNSYLIGRWPPGKKSGILAWRVFDNLIKVYTESYQLIKSISSEKEVYVSLAKYLRVFLPCPYLNLGQNHLSSYVRSFLFNWLFLDRIRPYLDFIGVNYYACEYSYFYPIWGKACQHRHRYNLRNKLNWIIYPQGLEDILVSLKRRYNLPIIITENGTYEEEDKGYEYFLIEHLKSIVSCLQKEVDIRGYFWWSLIDNFEWDIGYNPRFGLIYVDYSNFSRKIKPFAYKYAQICKNNRVEL